METKTENSVNAEVKKSLVDLYIEGYEKLQRKVADKAGDILNLMKRLGMGSFRGYAIIEAKYHDYLACESNNCLEVTNFQYDGGDFNYPIRPATKSEVRAFAANFKEIQKELLLEIEKAMHENEKLLAELERI